MSRRRANTPPLFLFVFPDLLLIFYYWKAIGDKFFVVHHLAALYAYYYVLVSALLSSSRTCRQDGKETKPRVNSCVLCGPETSASRDGLQLALPNVPSVPARRMRLSARSLALLFLGGCHGNRLVFPSQQRANTHTGSTVHSWFSLGRQVSVA